MPRSALSRNQPTTNGPTTRVPRKSSSFLSLRREKEKPVESPVPSTRDSPSSSRTTPPTSFIDTQFTSTSRTGKAKGRKDSPARDALALSPSVSPSFSTTSPSPGEHAYTFPSFDSAEDLVTPTPLNPTPGNYLRTRSRTGPSSKSKWDALNNVPPLRFSGSSSTYRSEPRTPDDFRGSADFLDHFPVVVAAPIAGVEAMDALVDGMNGGDDFMGSGRSSARSRFGIPNHHPLYQPPLPTPPPGVVLGGPKSRRQKHIRKPSVSTDSSASDSQDSPAASYTRPKRRRNRPPTARSGSSSTVKLGPSTSPAPTSRHTTPSASPSSSHFPTRRETVGSRPSTAPSSEYRKSVVPSISDIIRAHAPAEAQARSKFRAASMYTPSHDHSTLVEEPEPATPLDENEFVSRSSIDSVADEVRRTIRSHTPAKPTPAPPSAFMKRHSTFSDTISLYSPRSDPGANPSVYSSSAASIYQSHSPVDPTFLSMAKPSPSQAVAQYLRSTKLTALLKLTRQPHASQDNPLTVSFSDLGSPTGFPVLVFLGLGCVRHIMGLYDEMAECLGLRLITIDRWGLGRTDSRPKSSKGIIQWASAVEEVLDLLKIRECSIMAHSAGAPYALSFANKVPSRVRGDICLLAPWVGGGESSGYRWLKYVPNGILKTAQAAEWKIQAWMIGKPPTIAYEGIGYTAPKKEQQQQQDLSLNSRTPSSPKVKGYSNHGLAQSFEARPRPSIGGSSTFSEYDDLRDFDGKFGSQSTLGMESRMPSEFGENGMFVAKRKTSKGFLNRLKSSTSIKSEKQEERDKSPSLGSKKLKALRSMSSLKGKGSQSRKSESPSVAASPQIPPTLRIERSVELDTGSDVYQPSTATPSPSEMSHGPYLRSNGHRSVSFTSSKTPVSMPSSPSPSALTQNYTPSNGPQNYQAALGNALIAASHAESSKGTHDDLLQILNHDNQPWGFSYSTYPHNVRVWYGDRDEKIAEHAVRWMERTMGPDRCSVRVVKGADHGLMYRSSVVVDVLESMVDVWRGNGRQEQPFAGLY
ncbi:hypothetical protein DFP72DRAFT_866370 [Ephemerocybe angulata]|uniref:AB hydrolase-1 domain-containing protein n=1 Tax=Ephemerocybe angulata TaxID=980116 RepID=A0A8H6IKL6_9AGAR|nr:hypothetical protein DFP72DRAFT_866370 [Tulosesus angulatus]